MRGAVAALVAVLPMMVTVPAGASAARTPECRSADLRASFVDDGAAAGSWFGTLRLRNVSGHTCFVRGYGGLSFVGHGDGTQIGRAADRTPSTHPKVVLGPGQRARSEVRVTSPYPYPAATCRRTRVDGFRVYVPDSRVAKYVPHRTVTCANPRLHMIEHRAFRRG